MRVQRLQEIADEDARAEGVDFRDLNGIGAGGRGCSYAGAFAHTYASIWSDNPWVWAETFKTLKGLA